MRKRKFICFTLCTAMLISVFLVTGCGEQPEQTEIVNPINITISIDYPKKSNLDDITDITFKIEEDSSVLEAIQLFCNVNEMPVNVETTVGTIVGINDLNNGDIYSKRIWQFKVNGELSDHPAGEIILQEGDRLEWVYRKSR